MKVLKQVVGIDISKDTFHTCLGTIDERQVIHLLSQCSFSNNEKGFRLFQGWVKAQAIPAMDLWYIMEATGVYYENLAYFLSTIPQRLCVLVPTRAKHFAKSLEMKSKTDKVDAAMLCRIGLERNLRVWSIPSPGLKSLKAYCREYRSLKENRIKINARLHALSHSYTPEKTTIRRLKQQLKLMDRQQAEVRSEILLLIKSDAYLQKQFANIEQVNGLSTLTIATVVAETNGFAAVENTKQLTSYAGLDVMMDESGLRKGKTRISKKGNRHLRTALYLPALSAVRYNQRFKQCYENMMERNRCGKVGITAVARKMLILIYTLWKNQAPYDPLMQTPRPPPPGPRRRYVCMKTASRPCKALMKSFRFHSNGPRCSIISPSRPQFQATASPFNQAPNSYQRHHQKISQTPEPSPPKHPGIAQGTIHL